MCSSGVFAVYHALDFRKIYMFFKFDCNDFPANITNVKESETCILIWRIAALDCYLRPGKSVQEDKCCLAALMLIFYADKLCSYVEIWM